MVWGWRALSVVLPRHAREGNVWRVGRKGEASGDPSSSVGCDRRAGLGLGEKEGWMPRNADYDGWVVRFALWMVPVEILRCDFFSHDQPITTGLTSSPPRFGVAKRPSFDVRTWSGRGLAAMSSMLWKEGDVRRKLRDSDVGSQTTVTYRETQSPGGPIRFGPSP